MSKVEKLTNIEKKEIKRIPQDFPSFVDYCNKNNPDIYIFGADIAGKVIQHILVINNITIKAFFDNNKNKCNTIIDGVEVLQASKKLDKLSQNSIILIASTYIHDIINQIESVGIYNWIPISNIIESNPEINYREIIKGDLQHNHSGGEFTKDFVDFAVSNMVNSQNVT